ncbi:MAG: type II secretion system F family protein [Haloarculaceae archaeon]
MPSPLWYLPSLVVVGATATWLAAKGDGRADRIASRFARVLFGRFVIKSAERKRVIESAYIGETYRSYASRTLLYTVLAFVAGAIGGGYVVAGTLVVFERIVRLLAGLPSAIRTTFGFRPDYELVLSDGTWWAIVFGGGLTIGLVLAVLAYVLRWNLPESTAEVRRRSIDEGLPRTTAFMYALSRGGMEFPQIVRILGKNSAIYGEAANEMSVTVREMDLFGRDMITAIRRMARRTPSEQFKTFAENLASVLQSGSSLPNFLRDQYERFREEAKERQEEVLELLATIAEAYVTVLVAGVLFLITILLVFGLTTTDTLIFLQMIGYLLVPLANAGFALYLAQKLEMLGISRGGGGGVLDRQELRTPKKPSPPTETRQPDGGLARDGENRGALALYDHVGRIKSTLQSPIRTIIWNPTAVLYLTVPVAILVFLARLPGALGGTGINVRALDDLVVQSALLVLGTYAIVRELYKRRIDRIEAATPELLERLASLNEAGMTVTEGLDRVRGSDLGVLTPEVERIHRDIEFGSTVSDAFVRFGQRVRTTAITRVVTLLVHSMRASGRIGEVLRIAATQARADLRMRRQRRQQMFTYLVVIYISFLVFLVIILAVNEVLVPSLPESVPSPDQADLNRLGVNADQFARLGGVDKAAYTLVFFHTALVQAVCAGLVGGQFGEGSLKDGAKHAAIMLAVAYAVFVLVSSPVASIAATGATTSGDAITIESTSLSEGGYVAVYDGDANGTLLGQSAYLPSGTHENVVIPLEEPIREDRSVVFVPHRETTGDESFDYTGPPYRGGSQPDRPYTTVSSESPSEVEVEVVYVG